MVLVITVGLEPNYIQQESKWRGHLWQDVGVTFRFVLWPMGSLAVLTAIVGELTL